MIKRLSLLAGLNITTGYGLYTIQMAEEIERQTGTHVSFRPTAVWEPWGAVLPTWVKERIVNGPQPEPGELLIHPPDFCPTPGKRTAYFTMWEATRLPPHAVEFLNRAAVVIVPGEWNAVAFSAQGVNTPIRVVPLGIDTNVYHYRNFHHWTEGTCVFGCGGRRAHGGVRKGMDEVVEAFRKAFPHERDVRLKIKCFPDCGLSIPEDDRIELIAQYLTDAQMADWYASLHCFVSAAKSEGWGLMQHQAMAVGRPIISTCFGGVREFFNPAHGYPIPYVLEEAKFGYKGCGCWALPDKDSMVDRMREVYNNREEAIRRGAHAASDVCWRNTHESARRLIEVLGRFQIMPVELRER